MWGHQISKSKINEPWTFKLRSIGSMSTVNHLILTYFGNEIDWLFCESVMSLSWYWRYCFYNMSIHGIPSHSKKLYICNFKFWCAWWQSFLIEVSHFGCLIFLFYIVLVMQFWISASCSSSFDILITVSACIIISDLCLHCKCRDIQASSVLLDDNFEVRLGSLGEICTQQSAGSQSFFSRILRSSRWDF